MRSTIVFTLFLALFMITFINMGNARQIRMDDDDDDLGIEIADAKARSFLDSDEDFMKRADSNCPICSSLTRSRCCAPNLCVKKTFHNECIKIKTGK
ncbi:unnamed protein product [Adineta ricciae]|uniref:Uncharacterized protein n=1 Tax=Adineta ricciae TaxID=249248 RepID=A0A815WKS8_ADIRI|nr:unnamed protein product [Adineta ricciae]CAF1544496.1 unnamed protein product [Adineta ricciae]